MDVTEAGGSRESVFFCLPDSGEKVNEWTRRPDEDLYTALALREVTAHVAHEGEVATVVRREKTIESPS
jgi:hypothetical protein